MDKLTECFNKLSRSHPILAAKFSPKQFSVFSAYRGIALVQLKRNEEAIVSLDRALESWSDNAFYWAYRGRALRGLKRYEEALASYDKAIQIDPKDNFP